MSEDAPDGSILSDSAITESVENGDIVIDPWTPAQLNSASYDLTLGDEVVVYQRWVGYDPRYALPEGLLSEEDALTRPRDGSDFSLTGEELDIKEKPKVATFKMDPKLGWLLKPGIGYLMHTRERVLTRKYEPIVDGKSSTGRLFMLIHFTAGYGDPAFNGQYTLEVMALHPIRIYPGMKIGQIRFHTIKGDVKKPYQGNYVGEAAMGAVPSMAWKQFLDRA